MTNPPPPPPPSDGGYPPPQGGYPPPPQGGYGQPPQGGYPPPQSGYPPSPQSGYPPSPQSGYPPPPQSGYPPPPQGGYGQPPQGGYPPPGGYGAPPQGGYPLQGGYGPPPGSYGGAQQVDIGEAFSWAMNKFSKNAAALIVPTIVYGLIVSVVYGVFYGLGIAMAPDQVSSYDSYDSGFSYSFASGLGGASLAFMFLGGLVTFVVVGAISSAYYAGLLDIANGQPVTVGSFFKPRNVGSVLVASLIIAVLTSIGQALCVIPGLLVSLFTMFALVSIVDRNLPPIDAIKESFNLVKANFVQALLVWLIFGVMVVVGALLCGIGLIVAVPIATLFVVHAYRKLVSGPIAPLTP